MANGFGVLAQANAVAFRVMTAPLTAPFRLVRWLF
jgi:hypothetical protein